MKITLAVLAIIVLASAGAWFYYLNNEEFQAAELTTIKRTTGSLATSPEGKPTAGNTEKSRCRTANAGTLGPARTPTGRTRRAAPHTQHRGHCPGPNQ